MRGREGSELITSIDKSERYDEGSDEVYEERKDMTQNLEIGMRAVLYKKKSKSVFSEKVFFTTKSHFSPYYTKNKSIFLTKTLFLSVLYKNKNTF